MTNEETLVCTIKAMFQPREGALPWGKLRVETRGYGPISPDGAWANQTVRMSVLGGADAHGRRASVCLILEGNELEISYDTANGPKLYFAAEAGSVATCWVSWPSIGAVEAERAMAFAADMTHCAQICAQLKSLPTATLSFDMIRASVDGWVAAEEAR